MKIRFKLIDGKVASDNTEELSKYLIVEDKIYRGLDIGERQRKDIFDVKSMMKFKIFIVMPYKGTFVTVKAFIVSMNDGTFKAWANEFLDIEDGDAIYTTREEADRAAANKRERDRLLDLLEVVDKNHNEYLVKMENNLKMRESITKEQIKMFPEVKEVIEYLDLDKRSLEVSHVINRGVFRSINNDLARIAEELS